MSSESPILAVRTTENATSIVENNMALMTTFARSSFSAATNAIQSLASTELALPQGNAPAAPSIALPTFPISTGILPPFPSFNVPLEFTPAAPPTLDVVGLDDIEIPDFHPTTALGTIPSAPSAIDISGAPDAPTFSVVNIPDAPIIGLPSAPDLVSLNIPTFTFPTLPTFDAVAPEFNAAAPSPVINWSEPVYISPNMDLIKVEIGKMLAGGRGMPIEIEAAIFDRGRSREDVTALKAVQESFDTFASRGFSMPPGMLAEQVNKANQQNQLAVNSLERDLLIKAADWQIENLRFAVTQGIALESQLISLFQAAATRSFEIAKAQLDAGIALYNALVSVYNARQNAYQVAASVFKTRIEAAISTVEIFKAQVEAEKVKGEINDQSVRVYTAQLQAISSEVEIYKAQIGGAQAKAELNRSLSEQFKSQVEAYAAGLNAQKIRFDAYESQVRGETAKTGAFEAETRAYAESVRAATEKGNLKVKNLEIKLENFKGQLQAYTSGNEAQISRIRSAADIAQSQTSAYSARVQAYSAEQNALVARDNLSASVAEAQARTAVALYEVSIKEFDAAITRIIEQAKIQISSLQAAAQTASQLAAGAMSALHVGATISASGSAGVTYGQSFGVSHSVNYTAADGALPSII
jgi:hypothetical protein